MKKLPNEQNKFREEVLRLKDKNRRLSEEKKNGDIERLQEQRDLSNNVKNFAILGEKYVVELQSGGHFLDSEANKVFLKKSGG